MNQKWPLFTSHIAKKESQKTNPTHTTRCDSKKSSTFAETIHEKAFQLWHIHTNIHVRQSFNDEFKEKLVEIQDSLKSRGVTGNYCSYGNLHMTPAFIGEMTNEARAEASSFSLCLARRNSVRGQHYDLPAIRKAVGEVEFEPFEMSLGSLGTFPTKAGVIWCGVKDGPSATSLANQLRERLTANGVTYSTLAFVPHISLVQHPSTIITDIEVPDFTIRVEQIHVMKSERIDGELVYSEI